MLNWLIPRREALMFLANDLDEHSSADFTGKEMNVILEAIGQSVESHQFWSLCQICFQIASWGANVSRFFHSCPIPSHFYSDKPCQLPVERTNVCSTCARLLDRFIFTGNL